jgi:uncharacterized protein (TIGR02996 family)
VNDLNSLLRAVIENPDEDTPRLMYADALMESEDAAERSRGQWIKGAVENRDRGFECYDHPHLYDVGFKPVPKDLGPLYDRGFVCEIVCSVEKLLTTVANELLWHRSQTLESVECCLYCGGKRRLGRARCDRCERGKRTVRTPRSCPDTAHPIRKVVLTTTVYERHWTLLQKHYSWVKFVLPDSNDETQGGLYPTPPLSTGTDEGDEEDELDGMDILYEPPTGGSHLPHD